MKCGGFPNSLHIVLARVVFPEPAVPAEQFYNNFKIILKILYI
jgi:hypothetical protein